MNLTRRSLLAAGSAAAVLISEPSAAAGALRVRKNIVGMTMKSPDIVTFTEALKRMRAIDDRNNQRTWRFQQFVHQTRAAQVHSSWLFLPWHRAYLRQLEAAVTAVSGDANFALPYWDWQETRRLPRLLAEPPFTPQQDVLTPWPDDRNTDAATKDYHKIVFGSAPEPILQTTSLQFYGRTRGKGSAERTSHDLVHDSVGGIMGNPRLSPWDPVFWFHHSNIDRVFSTRWARMGQTDRAHVNDNRTWIDEPLPNWGANWSGLPPMERVSDVVSDERLGYRYDKPYPFKLFAPPRPIKSTQTMDLIVEAPNLMRSGEGYYCKLDAALTQVLQDPNIGASIDGLLMADGATVDGHRVGVFACAGVPDQALTNARRLILVEGLSPFGFSHGSGAGEHDHGAGDGVYPMTFGPFGDELAQLAERFPGEPLGLAFRSRALEGTKPVSLSVRRVQLTATLSRYA